MKVGGKDRTYSNMMRMQNQAKLAAGAHQGYKAVCWRFAKHNTVSLFSVFLALCIFLCGVSNVFVCYKYGDGRDFPLPRFGKGSVMNKPEREV